MERVIFGGGVGQGLIMNHDDNASDYIDSKSITVADEEIFPNTLTALKGFFKHEIKYVGLLKGEKNVMCFYLGFDKDVLFPKHYYDCYYRITNDRLFCKYTEKSGRDFNFINNKWK